MAKDVLNLGTNGNLTGQIVWEGVANGPTENNSTVTAELQVKKVTSSIDTRGTWSYEFSVGNESRKDTWYGAVGPNWVTIAEITATVKHDDNGKGSCFLYGKITGPTGTTLAGITVSKSETVVLDTIPRASSVSCSSPYIGDAAIITIDKKSPDFRHTVGYIIGNRIGSIASKTSNTTLSLNTKSMKNYIYSLIPEDRSTTGTINCTTYNGNTQIGKVQSTEFNLYANEEDCKPDITGTIIDTNEKTIAITGDSSKLIKHLSKPKVTIKATPKYSSWIKSYSINLNDGQTSELQENIFESIGSNKITIKTTDSRGYSNSKDLTPEMVEYIKLHIDNIDISRTEDTSSEVLLNANGVWFNDKLNDTLQNTLSASFQYKLSGGTEWVDGGTITPTIEDNTFKFTDVSLGNSFNYDNEYQFKIIISDTLMTVGSENKEVIVLPKGQEVVAIGDDEVWVYGDLFVNDKKLLDLTYPVGSVYIGLNDINPSLLFGGTWERIKDTFLLSAGDNYEVGSTGGEKEHILTLSEMPNHNHGLYNYNAGGSSLNTSPVMLGDSQKGWGYNSLTTSEGEGQAHNNMPPYLTVNMWKRIA